MKVDLTEITEITESVFKSQTTNICLKFREAASIYNNMIDEESKSRVLKHTDALLFKFTLAVINLEFLWRISEHKRLNFFRKYNYPNQSFY